MELFFLALLILIMATALGSGYPVAFALPGAAILTIGLAAASGWIFADNPDAYFHSGGPRQWLSAGVTNLRGVYWEVERDTLIAIPLFIFMGIMLQRSKIAEDLLVTMAQLFGPVPGGLGISVVFVGALLAATTGIVGATVVAMGLISLPAMLRNNYSPSLATGTIAASGTLGQIIPPSIVLIILADQLASASDQASTARKALHKEATGELSMPSAFDVASTSAGEMFLGAFVPGLVLVVLYMIFILVFALLRPHLAPAVPYEGQRDAKFWMRVFLILVPPLALIFLVLGSIIAGIATVNQAGAIGAAGALIMAGYRLHEDHDGGGTYIPAIIAIVGLVVIGYALSNYDMNLKSVLATQGDPFGLQLGALGVILVMVALVWSGIRVLRLENTMQEVMVETAKTTSLVFIILLGAAMLTAAFRAFGGEELVREFLNSLPGGFWTQFIIVMAVIFILGFFLDFIEIAVVVVPIVAPILLADPSANITAVWLGVMIGLNIQTSFLTPPFGFALFYLRGVAPAAVKTVQMYKGVIAFIVLQLSALAIVGYYPQLVNYLPNRVSFLSETSPPPRNPKLQVCLDEYVIANMGAGSEARAALDGLKGLPLSSLPEDLRNDMQGALEQADEAIAGLDDIATTHAAVEAEKPVYSGELQMVRTLEKRARRDREHADELKRELGFLGEDDPDRRAALEAEIAEYEADAEAQLAQIPEGWDDRHDAFAALLAEEEKARTTHRRNADNAYEALAEIAAVLEASPAFAALEDDLADLRSVVAAGPSEAAEDAVKAVGSAFSDVDGSDPVRSALSKVARNLRPDRGDAEAAMEEYEVALAEYQAQTAWRADAAAALSEPLNEGLAGLSDTLGARVQDRLSRDQALFMAGCTAGHRDISINF